MHPRRPETSFANERNIYRPWEIGLVLLAAAFAYLLSFKLPFYPAFHESDHLIFMYEGWRMWGGEWIYRDFFEFTFPGTQTYYGILFHIFGPVYWISAATVVLIAALSCWVLIRVSREVIPSVLYFVPALIFIFFGFRWFGVDPSHRMFSPFILMGAVLVVLGGTNTRRLIAAGLLCAVASFFTQQRGAVGVAAISVFLLLGASAGLGVRSAFRKICVLVASFVAVLGLLCLPFVITAGPSVFYGSTVEYTVLYYSQGTPNQIGVYLFDLGKAFSNASTTGVFALLPTLFYAVLLPLAAVLIAGTFLIRKDSWASNRPAVLLALVSVFSLLSTTAPNQGRLFQISMPMLVLAVWWVDRRIFSGSLRTNIAVGIAVVTIGLSLLQAVRFQANWKFIYWETPAGTLAVVPSDSFERYRWVSEHTSPGDTFYEAAQPFIYFPLQLRNPARYGQIWPTGYTPPEHVAETVDGLRRNPPRFILWRNDYNKPDSERAPGDHTGPLAEFVKRHYTPVGPVYNVDNNPTQIWELKGPEQFPK